MRWLRYMAISTHVQQIHIFCFILFFNFSLLLFIVVSISPHMHPPQWVFQWIKTLGLILQLLNTYPSIISSNSWKGDAKIKCLCQNNKNSCWKIFWEILWVGVFCVFYFLSQAFAPPDGKNCRARTELTERKQMRVHAPRSIHNRLWISGVLFIPMGHS